MESVPLGRCLFGLFFLAAFGLQTSRYGDVGQEISPVSSVGTKAEVPFVAPAVEGGGNTTGFSEVSTRVLPIPIGEVPNDHGNSKDKFWIIVWVISVVVVVSLIVIVLMVCLHCNPSAMPAVKILEEEEDPTQHCYDKKHTPNQNIPNDALLEPGSWIYSKEVQE